MKPPSRSRRGSPEAGGRRGGRREQPPQPSRQGPPGKSPTKPGHPAAAGAKSNAHKAARAQHGPHSSAGAKPSAHPAARTRPGPQPARAQPSVPAAPRAKIPRDSTPPVSGNHVWTTREAFEQDLAEELLLADRSLAPRIVSDSLVVSNAAPPTLLGARSPAFARQAFPVHQIVRAGSTAELVAGVTHALFATATTIGATTSPWALHVWVPDSVAANRFARTAETLERAIEMRAGAISSAWAGKRTDSAEAALRASGFLLQVCLLEPKLAIVGGARAANAPAMHPGGRARMRVGDAAPSRAAMKLEEAIAWFGHGPSSGETCVDLGAAPGGWSWVVLERGARVLAIDPGSMSPELMQRRSLSHIRGSAFDYEPRESVDWLLCDMVWRPLEVAALLARWGRKGWARFVIANIKLPMRNKAEFVARIRQILIEGGWQDVRFRHLYHDREEVSLAATSSAK